jgi:hypothetical protein
MPASQPRAIRNSLNDERDTDDQATFARLLEWYDSTPWRKLDGDLRIAPSDELAIRQASTSLKVPGSERA